MRILPPPPRLTARESRAGVAARAAFRTEIAAASLDERRLAATRAALPQRCMTHPAQCLGQEGHEVRITAARAGRAAPPGPSGDLRPPARPRVDVQGEALPHVPTVARADPRAPLRGK